MSAQGHIRKRGDAWEIRYELPRVGNKRRTKTVAVRGSYREAQKKLRSLLDLADQGLAPAKGSLDNWLDRWLSIVKPEISPTTHEHYRRNVDTYLRPRIGAIPLAKLSRADVQQLFSDLAVGGRADGKPGPLAPSTVKQLYLTLTIALARAVDLDVIQANPAEVMRRRMPRVERPDTVVLTAEESTALLDATRGRWLYAPVLLAMATGARRGEILALRWADVGDDVVNFSHALRQADGELSIGDTKNRKVRSVAIGDNAAVELRAWRREQAEQLLRLGVRQSSETPVCTRPDGRRVEPGALTIEFWRLAKRLGLKVHFHSLRHSHATAILAAGLPPHVVQERLGHHSAAFTLDRYAHVIKRQRDDAAAKIDAIFQRG